MTGETGKPEAERMTANRTFAPSPSAAHTTTSNLSSSSLPDASTWAFVSSA